MPGDNLSAFSFRVGGAPFASTVPMPFTIAFLPMFGIGDSLGFLWRLNSAAFLCTTLTTIIAHFHYIVRRTDLRAFAES